MKIKEESNQQTIGALETMHHQVCDSRVSGSQYDTFRAKHCPCCTSLECQFSPKVGFGAIFDKNYTQKFGMAGVHQEMGYRRIKVNWDEDENKC